MQARSRSFAPFRKRIALSSVLTLSAVFVVQPTAVKALPNESGKSSAANNRRMRNPVNKGFASALVPLSGTTFYYYTPDSNDGKGGGRERVLLTLDPDCLALFHPADVLDPNENAPVRLPPAAALPALMALLAARLDTPSASCEKLVICLLLPAC